MFNDNQKIQTVEYSVVDNLAAANNDQSDIFVKAANIMQNEKGFIDRLQHEAASYFNKSKWHKCKKAVSNSISTIYFI